MGEKGNLGEVASAVVEHGESSRQMASGLAAKVTGELAAGMAVGAAGEKIEERSKRRRSTRSDTAPPADSDS
jgi:hypothetical protein